MTVLVSGIEANRERLAEAVADPLLLATDVAEELVKGGIPFREAHEQVAASVRDGSYRPLGTAAESVAARRPRRGPGDVAARDRSRSRSRFGCARRSLRLGFGSEPVTSGAPAAAYSGWNPTRRTTPMKRIALVAASCSSPPRSPASCARRAPRPSTRADDVDTVTVTGTGVVTAVPDRAQISAGVESRAPTAQGGARGQRRPRCARCSTRFARAAARTSRRRPSPLSTAFDDQGQPNGFVASNIASAETTLDGAGALIDAAVDAGANTVYGPSLSRSDAEELYRDALEKAVEDAKGARRDPREGRGPRARPRHGDHRGRRAGDPGRGEGGDGRRATRPRSSPGPQETTATVSVTFELR